MINKLWIPLTLAVVFLGVIGVIRYGFGGPEDSWLCQSGQWVKHGHPDSPPPVTGCGQFQTTPVVQPSAAATSSVVVGGDRDEHGCIGSAGYSWCATKNKCLRIWEEPCPGPTVNPVELATIIKQLLITKHGPNANQLTVKVAEITGDYAKGGASGSGGGGMWFAAKVGNNWQLVWDGNGTIDCASLTPYPDYPTKFIPECWDTANNKAITR